jgi:hypothetical protein
MQIAVEKGRKTRPDIRAPISSWASAANTAAILIQ